MSTLELSKATRFAIAISALLLAPLTMTVLARGGGGHGGGGGSHGGSGFQSRGGSFHGSSSYHGGRSIGGVRFQSTPGFGRYASPPMGDRAFSAPSGIRESRNMGNRGNFNSNVNNRFAGFPQGLFEHRQPFDARSFDNARPFVSSAQPGDIFSGATRRANGAAQPGDIFSGATRQANGHAQPSNVFSGNTRLATGGSMRGTRGSRFLANTGPGFGRFQDRFGRHQVFEDRGRFHEGFRDGFHGRDRFRDGFHKGFHHRFNNDFCFRDRHHRLINFVIWPSFCYPVFYDWGPYYGYRYAYPYYCQRYVFVSLGGYWPDYDYLRYYWYPGYLYGWYGYDPVAQEMGSNANDYYTYNYDNAQQARAGTGGITPVNGNTFEDVRAKMNQQKTQPPAAKTPADTLFDEGVSAFGQGSYPQAADKFAEAMKLTPNDTILPFAYSQAQFANGQYAPAADTLRTALLNTTPDKMGVYYPRGLYLDENALNDQIDKLAKEAQNNPADGNLQLLLGYQWLGLGETQKAIGPLKNAQKTPQNTEAATMLLNLADKLQAGQTQ